MDLNLDALSVSCSACEHDNEIPQRGYHNNFLPMQFREFLDYEKALFRQTILKHESIFREQLQELHRLYKLQRNLMDDIRRRQQKKPIAEPPKSFFHQSSFRSVDANKDWHIRDLSVLDSYFNSIKVKMIQPNSIPLPNGFVSRYDQASESLQKNYCKRLFNLELSADEYIKDEEEELQKRNLEDSTKFNYNFESNDAVSHKSIHSSSGRSVCWDANDDVVRSSLHFHNKLTGLDVSLQDEKSSSAFCDFLNSSCYSHQEPRVSDPVVESTFSLQYLTRDAFPKSLTQRGGYLQLENANHQEDWFCTYEDSTGRSKGKKSPLHTCILSKDEHSHGGFLSLQVEQPKKRKLFGVEISDRKDHALFEAPSTLSPLRPVPHSSTVNTEPASTSSRKRIEGCCLSNFGAEETFLSNNSASSNKALKISVQTKKCYGEKINENRLSLGLISDPTLMQNGTRGNNTPNELMQHAPLQHVNGFASGVHNRTNVTPKGDPVPYGLTKSGDRSRQCPGMSLKVHCNDETMMQKRYSCEPTLEKFGNYCRKVSDKAQMVVRSNNIMKDIKWVNGAHKGEEKVREESNMIEKDTTCVRSDAKSHVSKDVSNLSSASNSSTRSFTIDGVKPEGLAPCPVIAHDLRTHDSEAQLKVKYQAVEKRLNREITGVRHEFDLNSCTAEEALSPSSSTKTSEKFAYLIDLEAPVVYEIDEDRGESPSKNSFEIVGTGAPVSHEVSLREAAEAIIDISKSYVHELANDASCSPVMTFSCHTLRWFAKVITSHKSDPVNDVTLPNKEGDLFHEDFVNLEDIDYFEIMTLNLTDTKIEEYCCQPRALESQEADEASARRPQRGLGKRGRQREDFQRDVLPGLVSLTKQDMIKDFQTIQGLLETAGCTWKPKYSKRITSRAGAVKGSRRLECSTTPWTLSAAPPLHFSCREMAIKETSFRGRGKRTRRPPRQRCPGAGSSHHLLK